MDMGISMTMGIVSGILNGLVSLVMKIVSPIVNVVLNIVLGPIFNIVISLLKWLLCIPLYSIGSLLLALVDFVEVLFRLLAGLPVDNGNVYLKLGNNKGGDLLIQLIQSDAIQQAFLSMCIVGMFLLIIMTIFSIIRSEYSADGSKSAKGPILEKAFKAIANLMLIPIVTIFGISIGNSVLDLLDNALKGGGDNPTISGLLFVTAASDAFYKTEDDVTIIPAVGLDNIPLGTIITKALEGALTDGDEGNGEVFFKMNKNDKQTVENYLINASYVKGYSADEPGTIASAGETGAVKVSYANTKYVTTFIDISEINYLIWLFGACFVIKALFNTCFGMVNRLYWCAAYFIISPVVMGMSVIKDSTASWRSKFLGQALSAYGTIIALNMFFIIVRPLITVELVFETTGGFFDANWLSSNAMTMILKAIFVLVGCLMIEKLAGEMGGYFGASNAMSEGASTAKATGSLATKGVAVAAKGAMIANPAIGAAMRGAGALAGKIGKGTAKAAGAMSAGAKSAINASNNPTGAGRFMAGLGGALGAAGVGVAKGAVNVASKTTRGVTGGLKSAGKGIATGAKKTWGGVKSSASKAKSNFNEGQSGFSWNPAKGMGKASTWSAFAKGSSTAGAVADAVADATEGGTSATSNNAGGEHLSAEDQVRNTERIEQQVRNEGAPSGKSGDSKGSSDSSDKGKGTTVSQNNNGDGGVTINTDNVNVNAKDKDKGNKDPKKELSMRDHKRTIRKAGALGTLKADFNKLLMKTPLKGIADARAEFDKNGREYAKGSAVEGAYAAVDDAKKKKREDSINSHFGDYIAKSNRDMARMLAHEFDKSLEKLSEENKKNAQKLMDIAKDIIAGKGRFAGLDDDGKASELRDLAKLAQEQGYNFGANGEGLNVNLKNGAFKFDIDMKSAGIEGSDKMQEMLKQAIKESWDPGQIERKIGEKLKEIGQEGNKDLLNAIKKSLEEMKNQLGGK